MKDDAAFERHIDAARYISLGWAPSPSGAHTNDAMACVLYRVESVACSRDNNEKVHVVLGRYT